MRSMLLLGWLAVIGGLLSGCCFGLYGHSPFPNPSNPDPRFARPPELPAPADPAKFAEPPGGKY